MYHPAQSVTEDLLAEWRWLVGGQPRLHGWSAAGDLFYIDEHGALWRLDTGAGERERVANSQTEFESHLRDPDAAEDLLLVSVVRAFESSHGALGDARCLGFTTLPVFGGSYRVENRVALSVIDHAGASGDVHRQIRDRPDGTMIRLKVVP